VSAPGAIAPAYRYRARCQRVIDGDTFVALVDLGFYASIAVHVRVHGFDAPELGTPEGAAARDYARTVLEQAAPELVLESFKDRRSFERWVCDVYVAGIEGMSFAERMVTLGYGRPIP
jgi:endonuclease YncB( thermonuclease family)